MRDYIKAEWGLFKKNKAVIIGGFCGIFLLCLLLLFSGVGTAYYANTIAIVAYVVLLFFLIAWYLSPASHWVNRQKIVIPTEQIVLVHGESKRTYLKIRMLVFMVLYFGMVLVIAGMQLPAFLIGGTQYSLWRFGIEVVGFTAFAWSVLPVLYLLPSRWLFLGIPGWAGFCGGLAGGLLSMATRKTEQQGFEQLCVVAVAGVTLGALAMLYGWCKAIGEERKK